MSSVLIQVADALAAQLNGNQFAETFTAERTYADWELPLDKLGELRIDVVPVGKMPAEEETRGSTVYEPACHIVLRKKFDGGDIEQDSVLNTARVKTCAVDPYLTLVEDIHEYLCQERLDEFKNAVWMGTVIDAAVMHKHLREFHQYTGIIRVTYRVDKDLPE